MNVAAGFHRQMRCSESLVEVFVTSKRKADHRGTDWAILRVTQDRSFAMQVLNPRRMAATDTEVTTQVAYSWEMLQAMISALRQIDPQAEAMLEFVAQDEITDHKEFLRRRAS